MSTLHGIVEQQARAHPARTAMTLKARQLSYADLQDQVERAATLFHERGLKAGDSFGIVMRNSLEFVIAFLAVTRLGGRVVPVNFLLKADEVAYIFNDAGVVGLLTQPAFLGGILQAKKKLPLLRDVFVTKQTETSGETLSFSKMLADTNPREDLPRAEQPDDTAMIIYTSGTTGKPKGAMLSHRNLLANAEQCRSTVDIGAKDVFLCLLPMFHSFAWTVCVVLPLMLGSTIVVIESIQPFGEVIKQILKRRVSLFVGVPPLFAALLRVPFWWPMRLLNPLRMCISGAAALPKAIHEKFEKKFGVPLMEGYGLTEASPVVTLNPRNQRIPGSIGKPLSGVSLRFVDDEGKDVVAGEVGEICVRGDNVMQGYYQLPDESRAAFLDDAHQWLRTGDLGYINADGFVFISDRKKDLIIVKGLNVYPKEVEDVLMGHAAVAEAAVIGVQDETGDEIIRAYVILKPEASVDKSILMKLCRTQLAPYKCPKDIEIRSELPKNTLGKILKRTLRDEAREKAP